MPMLDPYSKRAAQTDVPSTRPLKVSRQASVEDEYDDDEYLPTTVDYGDSDLEAEEASIDNKDSEPEAGEEEYIDNDDEITEEMKEADELLELFGDDIQEDSTGDPASIEDSSDSDSEAPSPVLKPKPVIQKAGSRRPYKLAQPRTSPFIFQLLNLASNRVSQPYHDEGSAIKRFLEKAACNQRIKMQQASKLTSQTAGESAFTMAFAGMFKMANPELDEKKIETTVAFLDAKMARKTKVILGSKIRTGKEFLQIDPASPQDLKKFGIYISIILDSLGRVVGVYIGSATGIDGVSGRWWSYETACKRGRPNKQEYRQAISSKP